MGHVSCVPGTLLAYKCAGYTAPINCFPPYANALHDPADRWIALLHMTSSPCFVRLSLPDPLGLGLARVCPKLTRVMGSK